MFKASRQLPLLMSHWLIVAPSATTGSGGDRWDPSDPRKARDETIFPPGEELWSRPGTRPSANVMWKDAWLKESQDGRTVESWAGDEMTRDSWSRRKTCKDTVMSEHMMGFCLSSYQHVWPCWPSIQKHQLKQVAIRDFPDSPGAETPHPQCRGSGFDPSWGN